MERARVAGKNEGGAVEKRHEIAERTIVSHSGCAFAGLDNL
jgi:hypothetical protein